MKRLVLTVCALALVAGMLAARPAYEYEIAGDLTGFVSPVERYGRIRVADVGAARRQLVDAQGKPVQLRGMSSFGLQWTDGEWILTDEVFETLARDWKSDLVRLAMYVSEDGYASKPAELLAKVEKGIELAVKQGLYVIVDWHILSPGDPSAPVYLDAGKDLPQYAAIAAAHPEYTGPQLFFAYLSQKYGALPNILWEVANEPNGNGGEAEAADVWKEKLLPYMQSVVNAIRAYDADGIDNIIICGTDNWSQFVDAPVENPVRDRNGQIMYTMHFYAGTHDAAYEDDPDYDEEKGAWLKTKVLNALAGGLAVFCTEWGTSLATGDGGPFIDFAERWLNFLDENKISWASWSLARKAEVSSSTLPATSAQPTDTDGDGIRNWDWNSELSTTGRFVRAKIRGEATPIYEDFALVQGFEGGNLGNLALNSDSPNTAITITAADINGNGVVALAGINGNGVWDNRLQFSSQNFLYGIYQNLMVDVYLPNTAADTALFTLKPVFQYAKNGDPDAMNWWADAIPDTVLTGKDFAPVPGTTLMKATAVIPIKALEPAAKDTLEHLILMVSLSADSADSLVYLDRLGFGSRHNGDARYLPMLPDEPGAFVKLPYDFESGQRESWAKEGVSAVDYRDIRIAVAETNAFAFPVSFDTTNNEWEDGARFSSGHLSESQLSADESREIKGIALDVYLEAGVMTQGNLLLNICPIPNGDGYWYAAGAVPLSPEEGEAVQSPDGVELVKYHVELPLAADGSYPFTVAIRNLVLALQSQGSDYRGMVYYDNIAFTK